MNSDGYTTVGDIRRRLRGEPAPLDPNARLFKERNLSGIFALARRDLATARRAAKDAGENPDAWFPSNPK
jgi:hypothetical protein